LLQPRRLPDINKSIFPYRRRTGVLKLHKLCNESSIIGKEGRYGSSAFACKDRGQALSASVGLYESTSFSLFLLGESGSCLHLGTCRQGQTSLVTHSIGIKLRRNSVLSLPVNTRRAHRGSWAGMIQAPAQKVRLWLQQWELASQLLCSLQG
jgi:hypothetical protein